MQNNSGRICIKYPWNSFMEPFFLFGNLVIIVTRFRFRFRFHNNSWCKWFCMRSACMYSTFVSFRCDVIYVIIFPQILKACLLYLITHINRWTNKRHNERPNERMNQRTNERMPILNWILKQHLRLFLDIMFEHIQHIMAMTEYMFSFPFALWITAVRWREKPPRDNTTYTIYISVGSSGRQANLYIHLYLYIYTNRMKREKNVIDWNKITHTTHSTHYINNNWVLKIRNTAEKKNHCVAATL